MVHLCLEAEAGKLQVRPGLSMYDHVTKNKSMRRAMVQKKYTKTTIEHI